MSAIDACLRHNAAYAADFSDRNLPRTPARAIAVVACMDARVEPSAILGLSGGDAHVIRNAGGLVTDDVIRSLTISQHLLGTREIMLIHHTDCGLLASDEAELKQAIEEKTGVRPPFAMGSFADLEDQVRRSVKRVVTSPLLLHRGAVRGFVYEVETGQLREVAPAPGV